MKITEADKPSKILEIAKDLAKETAKDKRPYSSLKWTVEVLGQHRYNVTESEIWEAYFAAINILKQQGIETPSFNP